MVRSLYKDRKKGRPTVGATRQSDGTPGLPFVLRPTLYRKPVQLFEQRCDMVTLYYFIYLILFAPGGA